MKNIKSRFSSFTDAELLTARVASEAEIRIRTHRFETEFKERMKTAPDATERAKLQHLLGSRRAQMAAQMIGLKLIDEIIAGREKNTNVEATWKENEDIVFVEDPRG